MSVEAVAYVLELESCPDGAELSRGQKLLLFCLADHHSRHTRNAFPSVPLLAKESLSSLSSTKRDLNYLEKHCVIEQRKPEHQGRGKLSSYVFLFLDDQDRLRAKLAQLSKGVQGEPLFCPPKRGPEGVQGEHERGSKGVQGAPRNKEESGTKTFNHEPCVQPGQISTDCPTWKALPEGLRQKVLREVRSMTEARTGSGIYGGESTAEQIAEIERRVMREACNRANIWPDRAEKIAQEFYNMALHEEAAARNRQLTEPTNGSEHNAL
jgi:hypothetical protein